jgi:hypothetical protein
MLSSPKIYNHHSFTQHGIHCYSLTYELITFELLLLFPSNSLSTSCSLCWQSGDSLSLYLSSTEAATPSLSIIVPSLPSTTLLPIFTSTDLQPKLSASLHGRSLHQFPQRLLLPLRPSVQRSSPCLLYLFQLRLLRLPTPTAALSSDQGSPPPPQQPHAAVDNNPSAAP